MRSLPQISEAEFEVMKVVWNHAPINTTEVTEKLTRTTQWKPKTIQTLLKRLVQKGAVTYEKQGRVFVYTPLVREDEYVNHESDSFLNHYYDGNIVSMVSAYLDSDHLTEQDIVSLNKLLSERSKKEGS